MNAVCGAARRSKHCLLSLLFCTNDTDLDFYTHRCEPLKGACNGTLQLCARPRAYLRDIAAARRAQCLCSRRACRLGANLVCMEMKSRYAQNYRHGGGWPVPSCFTYHGCQSPEHTAGASNKLTRNYTRRRRR